MNGSSDKINGYFAVCFDRRVSQDFNARAVAASGVMQAATLLAWALRSSGVLSAHLAFNAVCDTAWRSARVDLAIPAARKARAAELASGVTYFSIMVRSSTEMNGVAQGK